MAILILFYRFYFGSFSLKLLVLLLSLWWSTLYSVRFILLFKAFLSPFPDSIKEPMPVIFSLCIAVLLLIHFLLIYFLLLGLLTRCLVINEQPCIKWTQWKIFRTRCLGILLLSKNLLIAKTSQSKLFLNGVFAKEFLNCGSIW